MNSPTPADPKAEALRQARDVLSKATFFATMKARDTVPSVLRAIDAALAAPLVQPGQVDEAAERVRFETYFAASRRSRGVGKKPSFYRLKEEPQAYADDHTQRHWWTWQNALSTQADNAASVSPVSRDGATCELSQEDTECGTWLSACGGDPWYFEAEDPTKNGMRFCIHCGKRMVQAAARAGEGAQS